MKLERGFEVDGLRKISAGRGLSGKVSLETSRTLQLATVLLIDDDVTLGRAIQHALRKSASVIQMFDGLEIKAIDLATTDLILLDYKMPGRNGLEVLEDIRALDTDIPVVFATSYGEPEIKREALKLGATEYISKPYPFTHLEKLVTDLLEGSAKPAFPQLDFDNTKVGRAFSGRAQAGEWVEGSVIGFGPGTVKVCSSQAGGLLTGSTFETASFNFGSSRIKLREAFVLDVQQTSEKTEFLLSSPRRWNIESLGGDIIKEDEVTGSGPQETTAIGLQLEESQRERDEIPDSLRLAVRDFADIFAEIREDLSTFESELAHVVPEERIKLEGGILLHAETRFYEQLTSAVVSFEAAASEAYRLGIEKRYARFARKLLFPEVLSSPFMARIVERPIGVPGDFNMLGQILGPRFMGGSLYSRLINQWILSNPATDAYRFRINLLEETIRRAAEKGKAEGRSVSILSMASGVAYEIQRYSQNPVEGVDVNITLVDFSEDTLDEAKRQFSRLGVIPKNVKISFEVSSVIELANWSRGQRLARGRPGFVPEEEYDVVYCAGIFDYLKDRLIVSVTKYLGTLIKEEGVLVVSNYTNENPFSHFMGLVLDWKLIYRSVEDFGALVANALVEMPFEMITDTHGVEAYAVSRQLVRI